MPTPINPIFVSNPEDFSNMEATAPLLSDPVVSEKFIEIMREAQCEEMPEDILQGRVIKSVFGAMVGAFIPLFSEMSGFSTWIHEYVGHGLLGYQATHNLPEGYEHNYQVDGLDTLKAMREADSASEKMMHFGRLLSGYDTNNDGAAGVYRSINDGYPSNQLGESMGEAGRSAWISVAGSIPGLVLNSLTVTAAMALREKEPITGNFLLGLGMMNHFANSIYPWSAAVMSAEELTTGGGHDFANFAVKMSEITGVAPHAVALSTAIVWTAIVPAIALTMYFYQKSNETNIVPDYIGLQEWLQKATEDPEVSKTLQKYLESYSKKEELITAWEDWMQNPESAKELRVQTRRFTEYLIDRLPTKTLKSAKRDVLRKWQKLQVTDRTQRNLSILSMAGSTALVIGKLLVVFGESVAPFLATAGTVVSYGSPLLIGVSVISAGYETIKDLRTPNMQCPKAAKMVSVAKLVIAVATGVGICVGMFIPGLNVILIASIIAGVVGSVSLGFARQRIIKERFQILQSQNSDHWNSMYQLLEVYQEDKGCLSVKKSDEGYRGLSQWIQDQNKANRLGLMSDEHREQLERIGLPLNSKGPSEGSSELPALA